MNTRICRFRFEQLIYNDAMKILHSHTSDAYLRKHIAFSVYTHRKALKWVLLCPIHVEGEKEIFHNWYCYCISHCYHRFAQLIGDTFSLTLTIQLALNTVMISITLLQVCYCYIFIFISSFYRTYVYWRFVRLQIIYKYFLKWY